MSLETIPLFINGQKVVPSNATTYDVTNPATSQVIARAVSATSSDCRLSLSSAHLPLKLHKAAFVTWKNAPPAAKAAAIVDTDEYKAKVVKSMQAELGATYAAVYRSNINAAQRYLFESCDMAYSGLKGEILASDLGAQSFIKRIPMGVIFIISPWNAPVGLVLLSALPAIATGNTVVLKTSEITPGSQLIAAELLKEAGLPDGVLNVIHTSREDSGSRVAEIIARPFIRKIGFTGSDRVGKLIALEAAKHLKPCVLELGGKAPAIVLNGANLEAASRAIDSGAVTNSGQICVPTERVIIQRGASKDLIERIKALASKIKPSDPTNQDCRLSCVSTQAHAQTILSMVKSAIDDGAELLVGNLIAEGAWIAPHVVLGTKPGSILWDRESFGPVMTISVVDSVDEAIELANATTYSLTSSLWTEDLRLAMELSDRIHAGKVIVNGPTFTMETWHHQAGMGGSSGYGSFSAHEFFYEQLLTFQSVQSQQKYPSVDF